MKKIIHEINKFRDERDWRQFHNPKDLALSVSLEASELLENFQWKSSEEALTKNMENIQDEIADVLIYLMMLSEDLELDVEELVLAKLEKNRVKYPVEKSKGNKEKYLEL